jgi:hypothetical protein
MPKRFIESHRDELKRQEAATKKIEIQIRELCEELIRRRDDMVIYRNQIKVAELQGLDGFDASKFARPCRIGGLLLVPK